MILKVCAKVYSKHPDQLSQDEREGLPEFLALAAIDPEFLGGPCL